MIRGPVLPQIRERLWAIVAPRLEVVERGLEPIDEAFDCSGGQLGPIDCLARDALGAPVLVVLAVEGDTLLSARVLGAIEFLDRVGGALAAAIPEARLVPGAVGRVLVIGTEAAAVALGSLRRVVSSRLQTCMLEPFRIGGEERFAVRWLNVGTVSGEPVAAATAAAVEEFAAPSGQRAHWALLQRICERLDPEVHVAGERFTRRVTWRGHRLGEVVVRAEGLVGSTPGGADTVFAEERDVRNFADRLLRGYMAARQMDVGERPRDAGAFAREGGSPSPVAHRASARSASPGSIRSTLAAARLSSEEYCALGGGAAGIGAADESAGTADDVAKIVAAQEGSWPPSSSAD